MANKAKFRYRFIVALFLILLLVPLSVILLWSFAKSWPWPAALPQSFGLRGWSYFLDPHSKSLPTLLFSIGLSSVVALATLLLTFPAAKALAHYDFRFKQAIEILLFLPVIVPAMTVAMGIHLQFIRLGLANTFAGVVLIQIIPCIPYSLRILKSVFAIVGTRMEEQARVLGASPFKTFRHVTLPMLLPGIMAAASMVFIVSFSQYFLTALIGGGRIVTFPMLMFPFIESGDRTLGSVYSVVFILTTLVFLALVEGLTKKFYGGRLKEYSYV